MPKTNEQIIAELKTALQELDTLYDGVYQSPESVYALRKTIQSFNITITDWNTLLTYINSHRSSLDGLLEMYPDFVDAFEEITNNLTTEINGLKTNKADKIGTLPMYEVNFNDSVLDFITNNNVNNLPIIIKVSGGGVGSPLIGAFVRYGNEGTDFYAWELEDTASNLRKSSSGPMHIAGLSFGTLTTDSSYSSEYERSNNKKATLDTSRPYYYPTTVAVSDALALKSDKTYVDSNFGHTIEMSLDSSNYKVYISLKDKNGNLLGTQQVIDLPLETVVVGGDYDSTTKEVVLTLKDGSTIRFSVADLVDGLVSETQLNVVLGDYYNKDTIDDKLDLKADKSDTYTKTETDTLLSSKQNTLTNGQTIKTLTVDGVVEPLLGSGTINIPTGGGSGSAEWGDIGGDIADQTDLQNELQNIREVAEGKCNTFVLDDRIIKIENRHIYYGDTSIPITGLGHFYVYNESTKEWEDKKTEADGGAYDNLVIKNTSFDSQSDEINLSYTAGGNSNKYVILGQVGGGNDLYLLNISRTNTSGAISKFPINTGDIFLVLEIDVPDRWFFTAGRLQKLETSKVPLEDYATKTEVNAKSDLTNVAPNYDSTLTYTIGEVVINPSGKLVKANTNISTPEAYDSTHWDIVSVASDFVNLTGEQTIGGRKHFTSSLYLGKNYNSEYISGGYNANDHTIRFFVNGTSALQITDNAIFSNKDFVTHNGNQSLGNSTYTWKDLYLSGNINPNSNGYGLSLPSTASLTADKEIATTDLIPTNYVTTDTVQTITFQKRFINGISFNIQDSIDRAIYDSNDAYGLVLRSSGNVSIRASSLIPFGTSDLGNSNYKWRDLYVSRNITDGTYSVTVADISNGLPNVINASDIVNNTLTQAQYDLITNGKPTIIKGTLINAVDAIYVYCGDFPTNAVFRRYARSINNGYFAERSCVVNLSTKVISELNASERLADLQNIQSINGKFVPNYPTTNTSPQVLTIGASGGNLSWQDHMTEWYGTQAQYDALGTYDNNTIYNILES